MHFHGGYFSAIIFVALIAGFCGSYMSIQFLYCKDGNQLLNSDINISLYLVVCALIIAGFAVYFNENAVGSGKGLMTTALFTSDKYTAWYMPLLRMCGFYCFVYCRQCRWCFCACIKCGCKYWFSCFRMVSFECK